MRELLANFPMLLFHGLEVVIHLACSILLTRVGCPAFRRGSWWEMVSIRLIIQQPFLRAVRVCFTESIPIFCRMNMAR
ncbi:hypothetical protein BDV32DRAFT_132509 [Aspergillus pseudonomiae]|uniref:Uncharacterized protein n=1 Tax=Aspergillus pseudonomiae TaxID=1506151 RepID=A0A5N7CYA0_9EURO|nr:uncharacterized protein BDV37DRAFT_261549 [Aspergillus pseudonomiae]KAB8254369.1 hypothetical protein BDV32DRAFT_132509 [Aspergillus pseudonomiae]KAE8399131.1 hypothetical protein BDV37DRAFT_261549 [Aspergillus pseudonomiae]